MRSPTVARTSSRRAVTRARVSPLARPKFAPFAASPALADNLLWVRRMNSKRIAIACQGGGSQCAFVAGALKTLLSQGVHQRHKIVGLSGTSGGALTAALAWVGLLKEAHGSRASIGDGILDFWHDLSAQTPFEIMFDALCVQAVRLMESGTIPTVSRSPASFQFQAWSRLSSMLIGRKEFTDFTALVNKHFDFAELPELVAPNSPVLLVGAADVLEGNFKIFSSAHDEINADSLLASAAIPNMFPAVWVDGHAYWDGIFSSNPPVSAFIRPAYMGPDMMPEEIWVIQVNPPHFSSVPELLSDISDRRNQMAGNLSLQHELEMIDMVNVLLQERALTDRFRTRFGLGSAVPITVRFIRMSDELLESLDYPSKLSRQPSHIARLIADGEAQANAFLDALEGSEIRPAQRDSVELHSGIH
jgi:NTE family protein